MQRVQWRNGEFINADHFLRLEDWISAQVSRGRLGEPAMGLLPARPSGPPLTPVSQLGLLSGPLLNPQKCAATTPQKHASTALECRAMRALTYRGNLLEIDQAQPISLDTVPLGNSWQTLYLILGAPVAGHLPESEAGPLEPEGPVLALPSLRLGTKPGAQEDYLPVAEVKKSGRDIVLNDRYVPPCVVVDGHLEVASVAHEWRQLLANLCKAAMKHIALLNNNPEARNSVEGSRLVWSLCKSAEHVLCERPLRTHRFFVASGSLARDLVEIVQTLNLKVLDKDDVQKAEESFHRLMDADWQAENLHSLIKASQDLLALIRKAVDFPEPGRSFIPLAGDPEVTRDAERWRTRLPLSGPLRTWVDEGGMILIGLRFDSADTVEVRVHPSEPWSSIDVDHVVETKNDSAERGIDRRFANFVYKPGEDDLDASHIIFHTRAKPLVSNRDSVIIKLI